MVTRLHYCRRTLPEFRGYFTSTVSVICSHSSSVQGRCVQDALNIVLTCNVRTGPAEYTKVYKTFGTYELLPQDSALT